MTVIRKLSPIHISSCATLPRTLMRDDEQRAHQAEDGAGGADGRGADAAEPVDQRRCR